MFAQHMDSGRLGDQPLTAFVAADDEAAKKQVLEPARGIGVDPVDAGPLRSARQLEPLAFFNIQLGYVLGMGTQIGFRIRVAPNRPARSGDPACGHACTRVLD